MTKRYLLTGEYIMDEQPFVGSSDGRYYFWLGAGLRGPFDDYNEAHAELTKLMEGHGQEESTSQES